MNPRQAAALGCAYFLGWALVLAALILGGNYGRPVFLVIGLQENTFLQAVATAWFCFSLPCLFVAVALHREQKSGQKTDPDHPTK